MTASRKQLALIGLGATSLYLLKNLLERFDALGPTIARLVCFERGDRPGMGMPYHPATTDRYNLCNISSEEIPHLQQSLADWLRERSADRLARFGLQREQINETDTYARLALGEYFEDQLAAVVDALRRRGLNLEIRVKSPVLDLRDDPASGTVCVVTSPGEETFDRVVIATGHAFDEPDRPEHGYFASPWPIQKLLPASGKLHDFTIGTLGASLSAFDVVTSIAHRHGTFETIDGRLRFMPDPRAPHFRIVMHSSNGWLPHLQYDQCRPFREVYRHVSRETLLSLRDARGFLRLGDYWDEVCRPALARAFEKDRRPEVAATLRDRTFSLESFVDQMSAEHEYADPFEGMKREYPSAKRSVEDERPIHWKETLDDLMYTLSYHADLLPAEDHERFRKSILSFLTNVIAAMPLCSARILLALHEAGRLGLIAGKVSVESMRDGRTTVRVERDGESRAMTYRMFVDCAGQGAVDVDDFPFRGLVESGSIVGAKAKHADSIEPDARLDGIAIDPAYRVIGKDGKANPRIIDIAFPHAMGLRPYSYGLQACNHTAGVVIESWVAEAETGRAPPSNPATLTKLHDEVANEA